MKGDTTGADQFPFVRRRGDVALIGLSSAITTAPFMATGKIGTPQLHALPEILDRLAADGLFRVVLIHHPPVTKAAHRFKRLMDADKFRDVLRRHGAELVLHGHDHIHSLVMLDGPAHKIPAVGVPSASAIGGEGDLAGYNLYAIAKAGNGWRCEMTKRGFARDSEMIVDLGKQELAPHAVA
jgi:3',5'-cyclic AMP phosphodiesterase CpdA